MGFRFTLESANTVANLTCGRIYSCYDGIYSSHENYESFLYFLDTFTENMYSNRQDYIYHNIKTIWRRIKEIGYQKNNIELNSKFRNKNILNELRQLSLIFDQCRVKSLLLPSFECMESDYFDDFMISEHTIHKLFQLYPDNSCLILQPQDRLSRNSVIIFDAFPNFDIALKQADLWPAVMFWDKEGDFAFVPVKSKKELIELYEILYFERNSFAQLKRYAYNKKEISYYYFHLSDLHFGNKNIDVTEKRLKSLIKAQLSTLEPDDKIDFIVTGDAVNSPSKVNNNEYIDFSEFLEAKSGKKPIFVLGNHDVNKMGLAFKHNNQTLANIVGKYPKTEINDEIKVIFLQFNSNTNGHLAEGEIGQEQLSEMGNLLDKIPDLWKYKLIAVLHHHVANIEKPNFYDKRWFEKILPKDFLENSLRLIDADIFLEWLKQRNVKIILHGHKHIPFISKHDGIHIISCGSSTGQITHKDSRKTYLSYNILKFTSKYVVCSQFAEELLGAGAKNIRSIVIDY